MKQYLSLLADILAHGTPKPDRTGTGTLSVFGRQLRFDLTEGFPLLTTKRLHWPSIAHELLWMISGSTNVKDLQKHGVTIWDEWAAPSGGLGPIYGYQWRFWPCDYYENPKAASMKHIDQLGDTIERIKSDPHSRRHLVSAWNVADLSDMALPPCHYAFQFYIAYGRLSLKFDMRSTDVFLGLPFNIASYALLTHLVAKLTGFEPGELVASLGDVHLYTNHIEQAKLQLTREPRPLPKLTVADGVASIDEYRFEHLTLEAYNPHPHIAAKVAV